MDTNSDLDSVSVKESQSSDQSLQEEESLTEEDRKLTIDGIYLGVDKVEELEKELITKKEEIENTKNELKTLEEEVAMITEIKLKTENTIAIFQRISDRGSLQKSDCEELDRLTKELTELENILNDACQDRYSYLDDFYKKIGASCERIKTMIEELKTRFPSLLCKNDDAKNCTYCQIIEI